MCLSLGPGFAINSGMTSGECLDFCASVPKHFTTPWSHQASHCGELLLQLSTVLGCLQAHQDPHQPSLHSLSPCLYNTSVIRMLFSPPIVELLGSHQVIEILFVGRGLGAKGQK